MKMTKERKEELANRARLRERAALEKKREDEGKWCSGVGLSAGQLNALLDKIEELENELQPVAENEAGASL